MGRVKTDGTPNVISIAEPNLLNDQEKESLQKRIAYRRGHGLPLYERDRQVNKYEVRKGRFV